MCQATWTENYYSNDLTGLLLNDDIIRNVNDDLVQYDSSDTGSSDVEDE